MSMDLKDSCRLCLGKDEEIYKLFDATHGECTLADELNSLLDFKIENKENLPNFICGNCYKINAFFKEFRRSCARVKDRLNQLLESLDVPVTRVEIKLEEADGLEIHSGEQLASTKLHQQKDKNTCPAPTVSPDNRETLETLRSKFRGSCESAVDGASINKESPSAELKAKKRKNTDLEYPKEIQDDRILQDPLLTVVKSECISDVEADILDEDFEKVSENDICEYSAVNDETSVGVSGWRNLGSQTNSGSNQSSDSALNVSNLSARTLSENVHECSVLPSRKRLKLMVEENESLSNGRESTRSLFTYEEHQIPHEVKQEEIEIFDPPFEDENTFASSEGQESPERRMYSSDGAESDSTSSEPEDAESWSSAFSQSSDESDDDTEMLLCLALLL